MSDSSRERKEHRCQALGINAELCSRKTNYAEAYHGNSEIYSHGSGRPTWVLVWLCEQHKTEEHNRSFKPKYKRRRP